MGTHEYEDDPRNENVWISVNGELLRRPDAKISVLDAGFLLGDGVWEAFRLHRGVLVFLDDHLDRLWHGAEVIDLEMPLSREQLVGRIQEVIEANEMYDGVHIRLIVTRGLKPTPYQAPWVISSLPTIVIIPEHKRADIRRAEDGIRLVTVDVIRGPQNVQDPRINSLSKHNCIAGCIDAARKGGDEGLMLDPNGNVASCNSTHFFIVRDDEVWTSSGEYCLNGITRRKVLDICGANGIAAFERDFTIDDVRSADEAFVTGTFAGVTPVIEFDGEEMSAGVRGPMAERIQNLYIDLIRSECGG
ncbi:MAG: aminotransferase class IV [Candidatus Thalassarchaeum sp.]|uniref:Putative aminotransferase class IV n=1 Tax=uncultured marine microorganism HF4000_ANIW137P11 TaxID=455534 RepID=B3T552_9ZZZZ|nr:putative aminotransferase class IV [uncultured marine microorganism HF4000_ANIW137P11]MCH2436440.1 aminotransferase class IV [Candidatus Thalassarchaeum sp.]